MKFTLITPRRIKTVLISLLILMTTLFAVYFLLSGQFDELSLKDVEVDSTADLKLKNIEQISKRNGVKEWSLKASSAKFLKSENKARLEDISAVFYMENGEKVFLTSKHGTLFTKTENLTLSGKVVVTYQEYLLATDKLHYEKKRHIIYSNTAVEIKKGASVIRADSMVTELNNQTTTLKGNIKGKFSEALAVM